VWRKSLVNTWNIALFGKLIIILSRISRHFAVPDGFLSRSQRSAACPILDTIEFILHILEVCLEHATKAQMGSRDIALLFLQPWR
jgi:hypothetical protein